MNLLVHIRGISKGRTDFSHVWIQKLNKVIRNTFSPSPSLVWISFHWICNFTIPTKNKECLSLPHGLGFGHVTSFGQWHLLGCDMTKALKIHCTVGANSLGYYKEKTHAWACPLVQGKGWEIHESECPLAKPSPHQSALVCTSKPSKDQKNHSDEPSLD